MQQTGQPFEHRWTVIVSRNGLRSPAAEAVLASLARAYDEPHRHYHDRAHIEAMLGLSAALAPHFADPDPLDLAIYFHDAVYDPARSDNEAASAALARDRLAAIGFSDDVCRRVSDLVLATRHGNTEAALDGDAAWLADIDLAILGAAPGAYAAYAAAIRREYAIFPDHLYRPGRKKVLAQMLHRPRLYATSHFHRQLDAQARINIAAEIAAL